MKIIYEISPLMGVQEIIVLQETDRSYFGRWPEGFEHVVSKSEIAETPQDKSRFFTDAQLAAASLKRAIVKDLQKVEKFKKQLDELKKRV